MNKRIIIGLFVIMLLLTGCIRKTDGVKFKKEYESLNGLETGKNDKKYMSIEIDKENPIVYADYGKVYEILDSTGIIYFGFPECPWCRNAVPVLLESADELKVENIYYLNNLSDRDTRILDDNGNVTVEKEGTKEYYDLLDKIGTEFTSEYSGLNDPSIRRLYFPTVIFVKNGEIIYSHVATVNSQEDPYVELTDEQRNELKNIYKKYIKEVKNGVCDLDSEC